MKKKVLSFLLAFLILLTSLPVGAQGFNENLFSPSGGEGARQETSSTCEKEVVVALDEDFTNS